MFLNKILANVPNSGDIELRTRLDKLRNFNNNIIYNNRNNSDNNFPSQPPPPPPPQPQPPRWNNIFQLFQLCHKFLDKLIFLTTTTQTACIVTTATSIWWLFSFARHASFFPEHKRKVVGFQQKLLFEEKSWLTNLRE